MIASIFWVSKHVVMTTSSEFHPILTVLSCFPPTTTTTTTHQFHDKIDPMLEALERMSERLHQPPSISVEAEKIREQLTENKALCMDLEKLQPSYETLKQRGEEMIARSEGADKDLSARGTAATFFV